MGGEGAVEFSKFGFDHPRDCKDFKIIEGGMVGDIPRIIEDSAEDFGLETLDAFEVWLNPTTQRLSPRRLEDGFVDISFVSKGELG